MALTKAQYFNLSEEERNAYIEYYKKTFRRLPPFETEWRYAQRAKEYRKARKKKARAWEKQKKKNKKARAEAAVKQKKKNERVMKKIRAEQALIEEKKSIANINEKLFYRNQRIKQRKENTKHRHERRKLSNILNRRKRRARKLKVIMHRAEEYREEVRWLQFCNLTQEEREAYLEYKRQRGGRLPKEYTLKWLRPIRRREKALEKQERKKERLRKLRERRRERQRIKREQRLQKIAQKKALLKEKRDKERLEAAYKKYGYFRNDEEKRILKNRYANQRAHAKKMAELLKERENKDDEYGYFAIYRFRDQRAKEVIARKSWKMDILDYYEEMLQDNKENVKVPDLRQSNHYELLLARRIKRGEDNISYIKNKDGKLIPHILTNTPNLVIMRKEDWYVEENYYVYGYHPFTERKEFKFVYDELLLKDLGERYEEKRVMTHNATLYIICDDNFELIRTRDKTIAFRLYMTLQEEIEKNKVKGIFFLGEMGETTWGKFKPQLYEKTGWADDMMEK